MARIVENAPHFVCVSFCQRVRMNAAENGALDVKPLGWLLGTLPPVELRCVLPNILFGRLLKQAVRDHQHRLQHALGKECGGQRIVAELEKGHPYVFRERERICHVVVALVQRDLTQ